MRRHEEAEGVMKSIQINASCNPIDEAQHVARSRTASHDSASESEPNHGFGSDPIQPENPPVAPIDDSAETGEDSEHSTETGESVKDPEANLSSSVESTGDNERVPAQHENSLLVKGNPAFTTGKGQINWVTLLAPVEPIAGMHEEPDKESSMHPLDAVGEGDGAFEPREAEPSGRSAGTDNPASASLSNGDTEGTVASSNDNANPPTGVNEDNIQQPAKDEPSGDQRPSVQPKRRGADPSRDVVWPRHHTLCLAAAKCDLTLGGIDIAPMVTKPLESGIWPAEIVPVVLELCPWVLRAEYLNFIGANELESLGLQRYFRRWLANRVYYFYYDPEASEHPRHRRKGNLRAAYREFYETFAGSIAARTPISEERAKEFWLSVADRVPFLAPSIPEDQATDTEALRPLDPRVSASGGESRNSDNAGQKGGAK